MLTKKNGARYAPWCFSGAALLVLLTASACSRAPAVQPVVKKVPAGQAETGFLSSYANLKANPNFENTRSYAAADPAKNIRQYVAVMIDDPVVYVSSDVPDSSIPVRGVASLKEYFHNAINNAVQDAFPVVQSPGPLVLRLRSAIVGIDVGQQTGADPKDTNRLDRALNIGKVGVEMELVDSETGEQIVAAVDRQNLGEGAEVGSVSFSREEKFRAATTAFDGWASRLRQFLDSVHELSADDVQRAEQENFPYASAGAK